MFRANDSHEILQYIKLLIFADIFEAVGEETCGGSKQNVIF